MSYALRDVDFTRLKMPNHTVPRHKNIILVAKTIGRDFKDSIEYAADIFKLKIYCKEVKAVNPVFARAPGGYLSGQLWKQRKNPKAIYRGTFAVDGCDIFSLECFYNYGEIKYIIRQKKYTTKNKRHPVHNTYYKTSLSAVHALCLAVKTLN